MVDDKLSQAVYAVDDSMSVGRFDLAKKYSGQAVRLSPPPKERLTITPIYEN